jgi:uncharacterized protein (DUF169 family)
MGRSETMADYSIYEARFSDVLGLSRRPVALAFRDKPPVGVTKFAGSEPSSCSFWRLAARGMTFYTVPHDHCNCVLGSYMFNYALPAERAQELKSTVSQLTDIGCLKTGELSSIPRMQQAPNAVLFSPLGDTPVDPDLVVFVTRPMSAMILQEAAMRAGIAMQLYSFGRPTCLSLPTALTQGMVTSGGCVGNRIFSELDDDELYVLIAGRFLQKIAEALQGIADSNMKLREYHRERRRALQVAME